MENIKTIIINDKTFQVLESKNSEFWKLAQEGEWEPNTFKILETFLDRKTIFIDIGGWIGPTSMYGGQLSKETHTFEPDPIAFKELESNLQINKHSNWSSSITIYNKAVFSKNCFVKMGNKSELGNSMTSILFTENESFTVEAISLEDFIKKLKLDSKERIFVKIDIEGGEYKLMPIWKNIFKRKKEISLFLSIHPYFNSQRYSQSKKLYNKILNRLFFFYNQYKLIKSLPFKYLYTSDGELINRYKVLFLSIRNGKFITELLATNSKWHNS